VTMACASTADASTGGVCEVVTSANAVLPGSVRSGDRAVWQIGRVGVLDGGPDGVVSTEPNTLFATQGVFIP